MRFAGVVRSRLRMLAGAFVTRRGRRDEAGHMRRTLRPRQGLVALVLAAALMALIHRGLSLLFATLASEGVSAAAAAGVLAWALGAAVAGLFVFDLHDAVAVLLADSDLALLRIAPLTPAQRLAIKLADALPRTGALLVTLALPAWVAYARVWGAPAWSAALAPPVFFGLWAIPLGLGVAGALLLVRVAPAARAREALGLIASLTLTLAWLANAFVLPRLAEPGGALGGSLRDALARLPAVPAWLPSAWAADALAAACTGRAADAAVNALRLAIAGAGALAIAAVASGAALDDAQSRIAGAAPARRRASRGVIRRSRTWLGAFLVRDARLLARDWTVLADILTAAMLWTMLPLVIAVPLGAGDPALLFAAMLVALSAGLGYEIAARTLPFERRALAWSAIAPISSRRWLFARAVGAGALSAGLLAVAAITLGLWLRPPAREAAEGLALAGSALVLAFAGGLWTGAVHGETTWTNPRAMLSLGGRAIASGLLISQALGWLGVRMVLTAPGLGLPAGSSLVIPPLIAIGLSFVAFEGASRRLQTRGWLD